MRTGFIALSTVLVLSAIFLSIGIGIASRAISGASVVTALELHHRAEVLADACAEYALIELTRTLNYSGNDSILIEGDTCEILPISGAGNHNRTIETMSTVSNYTHRTKVEVSTVSPTMSIESWVRVASF